jgi:NAD(P)-dependent dehydrogenase (short-subunit alcohol dehydrogenase family)
MNRQTVIVTGATGGIGQACVKRCLEDGYNVVAFGRTMERLEKVLPDRADAVAFFAGDVSRSADCSAVVDLAVKRFGQLDSIIHWAATHSPAFWTELDAEEFNRVLAINLTGSFLIAQSAARHMIQRSVGSIVLCTSGAVLFGGAGGESGAGGAAYVASKAGIIGLVRSLARALGPHGIRVNAVSPGVTETPMISGYTAERRAAVTSRTVLGRLGKPDEIAAVGCFLISEAARYITGEIVNVNGGANFS